MIGNEEERYYPTTEICSTKTRVGVLNPVRPNLFPVSGFLDCLSRRRILMRSDAGMFVDYGTTSLGDLIITLRQQSALARHFPKITFHSHVPKENAARIPFNMLPSNLEIDSPHYRSIRYGIGSKGKYYDLKSVGNYSEGDFRTSSVLAHLGTNTDPSLVYKPIVEIQPWMIEEIPTDIDLIMFPDAQEGDYMIDNDFERYSTKSLPLSVWDKIFQEMPKGLRLAIVAGTAHPLYTNRVFEASRKAGHESSYVSGSLEDVMIAVLRSRTFVGMDSGTTHLAAEFIKAASENGRTIQYRQLFNEGYVPFSQYGIADNKVFLPALLYFSNTSTRSYTSEVSFGQLVAEFILSDDHELVT